MTVASPAGKLLFHEILFRGRGMSNRKRLLQMTLEMIFHFDGEEPKAFSVNLNESFLDEGTLAMLEALRKVVIVEFTDWPSMDCLQRMNDKKMMSCWMM